VLPRLPSTFVVLIAGSLAAGGAASAAVPFPEEEGWAALTAGGAPIADPVGDAAALGDDGDDGDLVGTPGWWSADPSALFLRVEVGGVPVGEPHGWGFLVDTDGVVDDFEWAITVDGPGSEIHLLANASGADGTWVVDVIAVPDPLGDVAGGEVRVVDHGDRITLDLQLAAAQLEAIGIGPADELRLVPFTSAYWPLGLADVGGCDGGAGPCDQLADVITDPVAVDEDLDGLSPPDEARIGTDPADADTDDDGVLDGLEADDASGDGVSDALTCDTDGDGLSDGTELGVGEAHSDTDDDGCFVADADPTTTTSPILADTDGGGLTDGQEDGNGDGRVDPWEADPLDPSDDADADGDGVPDHYDDLFGVGADDDSDGDGVLDADEGLGDTDGDDLPDFADADSDGDGLADGIEGTVDTDGDGLPDRRDLDSDGDGIGDAVEGAGDTDGDDTADFRDLDSDGDSLDDEDEGAGDFDADGIPDRLDVDSDDDAITDGYEGPYDEDTDGDGVVDRHDLDSDGDGHTDEVEAMLDTLGRPRDTDRDGVFDFRDTDSDGDGIGDGAESNVLDRDCDGVVNRIDGDPEDGFCDTGLPTPGIELQPVPGEVRGDPLPEERGCGCAAPGGVRWLAGAWVALAVARRRRR
jgi:hypothetical protein